MKSRPIHLFSLLCLMAFLYAGGVVIEAQQQQNQPQEMSGAANDNHGNIQWNSTVRREGDSYLYNREVQNQNKERRCRATWEVAQLKGTLEPGGKLVNSSKLEWPPEALFGYILYNGGSESGEARAEAPVWGLKSGPKKISAITGQAQFAYEFDGTVQRLSLSAKSEVRLVEGEYWFRYELKRDGEGKLPPHIRIHWDSIESNELVVNLGHDNVVAGKYIDLRLKGSFASSFKTKQSPILQDKSIWLFNEKGDVLAQAWLPAFAPEGQLKPSHYQKEKERLQGSF